MTTEIWAAVLNGEDSDPDIHLFSSWDKTYEFLCGTYAADEPDFEKVFTPEEDAILERDEWNVQVKKLQVDAV